MAYRDPEPLTCPSCAKRAELENNLDYVNQVLSDSAEKARALATTVLDRAKKNCGLS